MRIFVHMLKSKNRNINTSAEDSLRMLDLACSDVKK
jgi:hypothetical protein